MDKITVGKRVRQLRQMLGMSEAKVAEISGLHLNTIGRIEQGTGGAPAIDTLGAIARALHTTIEQLVKESKRKTARQ